MSLIHSLAMSARKWVIVVFALMTSVVIAQPGTSTCQRIISAALNSTAEVCTGLGRNQICYGNNESIAFPASDVTNLQFEKVGDRSPLSSIASLHLSPLDEQQNEWGVAIMSVQASLPDTLPGQNVTFVLLGGVTLETPFSTSNYDLDNDTSLDASPAQAYYFSTGIGQLRCAEAPTTGMIVQTPEGAGSVTLAINGVEIMLGSTAILTQSDDGAIAVSLVEGAGIVKANGVSEILVPGSETRVMAQSGDEGLRVPSLPNAIQQEQFEVISQAFTVLPRAVEMPEPATQSDMDKAARKSRRIPVTDAAYINGCPRPDGWSIYQIHTGDTLSRIAVASGSTLDALVTANCITDARFIVIGRDLFVPIRTSGPGSDSQYANDDDNHDSGSTPESSSPGSPNPRALDKCDAPKHSDHRHCRDIGNNDDDDEDDDDDDDDDDD